MCGRCFCTCPSPSASVDLSHLSRGPLLSGCAIFRTCLEPEVEGTPSHEIFTSWADATLHSNIYSGSSAERTSHEKHIRQTPPFTLSSVAMGHAQRLDRGRLRLSRRRSLDSHRVPIPVKSSNEFRVRSISCRNSVRPIADHHRHHQAQQTPSHRHDRLLLATPFGQRFEYLLPMPVAPNQLPGGLHQYPAQQP